MEGLFWGGFLNVWDGREGEENCLGMGLVRNERNEKEAISREEVRIALRGMRCGNAASLDGIAGEFLIKEG